jgi:hypothetical protein
LIRRKCDLLQNNDLAVSDATADWCSEKARHLCRSQSPRHSMGTRLRNLVDRRCFAMSQTLFNESLQGSHRCRRIHAIQMNSTTIPMADVGRYDTEDTLAVCYQSIAQIRQSAFGCESIRHFRQKAGGASVHSAGERARKNELHRTVGLLRHRQRWIFEKMPSGFLSASCNGT